MKDLKAAEIVFDAMKQDSNIERIEANPPECFCPICKSANIEIVQTFEDASGRTFFELRCSDCDSRFVLLEDLINSIRRNIENAKITEEKLTSEMEKFLEVDL
nr:MAG TPA: Transcription factor S-II (TFIIS) [Caudoviricetes sp.]